jgi:hypothetical protein
VVWIDSCSACIALWCVVHTMRLSKGKRDKEKCTR